jgi:thiamine kinase-like enzyme
MTLASNSTLNSFLPPAESDGLRGGAWKPVPDGDPVGAYLAGHHWPGGQAAPVWKVARRSAAVYVYREQATGWGAAAKFYAEKTGASADLYATRELKWLEEVRKGGLDASLQRTVKPLGLHAGTLFLEYVPGLTLEDLIAVRRSRPGELKPALDHVARLLARLHDLQPPAGEQDGLDARLSYARKVVDNLSRYGVLQDEPLVREGLGRLIDRWQAAGALSSFTPTAIHGDATTTNFIFPDAAAGVVAIDWERAKVTDPASDVGRLMAEVEHAVRWSGGDGNEALAILEDMLQTYLEERRSGEEAADLTARTRFYQAVSVLRIARNGWLPRLERTALVARALALLAGI